MRFGVILAFPRSGGTLLRRILDQHPDVSCPAEPWLTTACARFLDEVATDTVPVGVRAGLGFAGIEEAEIYDALRNLIFGFHSRMAKGKPVWVEKSGFDLFHLAELADLLRGHAKFVALVRHPPDVITSNLDLAQKMGRFLPEMQPWLSRYPAPVEALAAAWADRTTALLDFADANPDASHLLRYEDMVAGPEAALGGVCDLLGVARMDGAQLAQAVAAPARIGLGDWKTLVESGISAGSVGRWQKAMSRRVAGPLMAHLRAPMERLGYAPLPVPRTLTRAEAVKQFGAAARLAVAQAAAASAVKPSE